MINLNHRTTPRLYYPPSVGLREALLYRSLQWTYDGPPDGQVAGFLLDKQTFNRAFPKGSRPFLDRTELRIVNLVDRHRSACSGMHR